MGDIPSVDKMPTVKFNFPANGANIQPNTAFTVVLVCILLVSPLDCPCSRAN